MVRPSLEIFDLESVSRESYVLREGGRQTQLSCSSSTQSLWSDGSPDPLPGEILEMLWLSPERCHRHLQLEKDWTEYSGKSALTEHDPEDVGLHPVRVPAHLVTEAVQGQTGVVQSPLVDDGPEEPGEG